MKLRRAIQTYGEPRVGARTTVAGFLAWAVLLGLSLPATARSTAPDIVLVTIDTVRADHLGVYGYERADSPTPNALAAHGVLFEHALAQAPYTLPSMATVHAGLYPSQHGAVLSDNAIAPSLPTLAEVLQRPGYQTIAVVSHSMVDGEELGKEKPRLRIEDRRLHAMSVSPAAGLGPRSGRMLRCEWRSPPGEARRDSGSRRYQIG